MAQDGTGEDDHGIIRETAWRQTLRAADAAYRLAREAAWKARRRGSRRIVRQDDQKGEMQ